MNEPQAVLLNGVYGVGKTTVLVEMADRMEAAGLHYAALDLDWLAWAWPGDDAEGDDDHPTAGPLLLEHLDLIVGNLRRRGNDRFALAGSVASVEELERLREHLAMPLRVALLTAPLDVVLDRLGAEPTGGRAADAARTATWAGRGTGRAGGSRRGQRAFRGGGRRRGPGPSRLAGLTAGRLPPASSKRCDSSRRDPAGAPGQALGTMAAVRGAVLRSEISSGASEPSDSATTTASSPGSRTKSAPGLT